MSKSLAHDNNPFDKPMFVRRGRELAMYFDYPGVPMLPWPKDAFANDLTIAELMADGDFATPKIGKVTLSERCARPGCGNFHRNACSKTIRGEFGSGWQVLWYCSWTCKSGGSHATGRK